MDLPFSASVLITQSVKVYRHTSKFVSPRGARRRRTDVVCLQGVKLSRASPYLPPSPRPPSIPHPPYPPPPVYQEE